MTRESYYQGKLGGISDGTAEGERGASDYRIGRTRQQAHNAQMTQQSMAGNARVAEEGRKLGENLLLIVVALFLHPYFSFVGFWILGFGLLMAAPPYLGPYFEQYLGPNLGLSDGSLNTMPEWYGWFAAAVPVVLAVVLRKIVPRLMKWIFIVGCVVLAVLFVVEVAQEINSR